MDALPPIPIDYDVIIEEVYEAIVRPGDVVLDIGAHTGRHTLPLVRCVGRWGRVLAVEPLPQCRVHLQERLKLELGRHAANVTVISHALSDTPGVATFAVAEDNLPCSGLKTVTSPTPTAVRQIPVTVETLDRLCQELSALRYIKLDTEGAELAILRGGMTTLQRHRPVVAFEFTTVANQVYDISPPEMATFWQEQGYRLFSIDGRELDTETFCAGAGQQFPWDYVAIPAEKRGLVKRVRRALRRPRINWLAVRGWLHNAAEHATPGEHLPPLRSCPWLLRPLARGLAWLILTAARMITAPQACCNRALIAGFTQLVDDFERWEKNQRKRRNLTPQPPSLKGKGEQKRPNPPAPFPKREGGAEAT